MIRILLSKRLGELKWTQADLARATGIRPTTISDYYNEIAERMNLNHLDLICEALDCSPTEILVREPNPEPRVRNRTGLRSLWQTKGKTASERGDSVKLPPFSMPLTFPVNGCIIIMYLTHEQII